MKHLSEDDKEFIAIIGGILFIIFGFSVSIFTTIRPRATNNPKQYDLKCVTNYVKYPLEECEYKEKK